MDLSALMRKPSFPHKRIAAFCDRTALSDNLKALRSLLPDGVKFCAVVKADAYGHGFAGLLDVFERYADQYAVASVEEGEELRRLGIRKPVLVLGDAHRDEYPRLLSEELAAAVSTADEAERLSALAEKHAADGRAHIHIAVDTGMSRIGLPSNEAGLSELRRIAALPGLSIDGVFTHFATADEADPARTKRQLWRFESFLSAAEAEEISLGVRHCANSAALLNGVGAGLSDKQPANLQNAVGDPADAGSQDGLGRRASDSPSVTAKEIQFDMVRGGIAMYGLYPSDEVEKHLQLRPVMQLKAYLTHVKEIEEGEEISYGGLFRAEHRMRVGTVSCGYADGYPRAAGASSEPGRSRNRGAEVLVRGQRCPIVGRVCMDQLMIDLSAVPEAEKGDPVTLVGCDGAEEITFEALARESNGFRYELLCSISKRVPRVYL